MIDNRYTTLAALPANSYKLNIFNEFFLILCSSVRTKIAVRLE